MIAGLSRVILDTLFGVEIRRRIERVAGLVFGILVVGLFLVLGIAFGDFRVVAVMAAVVAVVGLYVFGERLHVNTTVIRVVLIALILALFLGLRLIVAPPP